jgi:formate hydrogenlyase transcriptional activator
MSDHAALNPFPFDFNESAISGLADGVVWTDDGGIILYCNEAAARRLGKPQHELAGKFFQAYLASGDILEWLNPAKSRRNHSPLEVQFTSGNKAFIYVLVRVTVEAKLINCFFLKEITDEASDPNQMLRIISEGTAAVVGGDFFRSLAYHIIISIGIRYAIVTECANLSKTRVRTLVYIERDQFLDNFEYDLSGTPCEIVMKGENYYCTADLDLLFPQDIGVKSYFGVPIFLSNGEIMGHIAIFDTQPLVVSEQKLNILKIFASRAGAEIERKRKDELLHENILQYKSIFDFSPVGLCEEDFSEVKVFIEQLKEKYREPLSTIFNQYPDEIFNAWKRIKRIRVNRAQLNVFEVDSETAYSDYMQERYMPLPAQALLVKFDSGITEFEVETEIISKLGNKRALKVKRIIMPGAESSWSKSLISCIDITPLKTTEANLKKALEEVQTLSGRLEAENVYLQQEIKLDHNFEEIVSKSEIFKQVLEKIELVADTDATVLILGESGTGKELIARAIHSISRRSKRPLVKVNCAALPANLIESELFGHEKGAFTGALNQKIGRFELADGGTLFLDEIGEMPLDLQSKLLRVLQEGEFERVGGAKTLTVDVRVIAATNRDLQTSVDSKEFRADLYYRLNVFPIFSPPLRSRKEDIPVLVNHFIKKYGVRFGKKITTVPKQVLEALMAYHWPGNVRELENIIERGLIVSKSTVLEAGEWLPKSLGSIALPEKQPEEKVNNGKSLHDVERHHIIEVLQKTNWKIRGEDGAAKILKLNPTTLEARMKKLGIVKKKSK